MPKRVIDGEGLWHSDKLAHIEPAWIRAEFANLIPLARANGSFECDPRLVWSQVYAYNRPEIAPEQVEQILAELERVKLLFRWTDVTGKQWGYWVGIEKPGRLPAVSRRDNRHELLGAEPPTDQLQAFLGVESIGQPLASQRLAKDEPETVNSNKTHAKPMASQRVANGCLGFGFGFGLGLGSGSGGASVDSERDDVSEEGFAPDSEAKLLKLAKCHPQAHKIAQDQLPYDLVAAMIDAITLEASEQGISQQQAYDFLTTRTLLYAQAVAKWPPGEKRFIANHVRWYSDHQYRDDPVTWERKLDAGVSGTQAVTRSPTSLPLSEQLKQGAVHAN